MKGNFLEAESAKTHCWQLGGMEVTLVWLRSLTILELVKPFCVAVGRFPEKCKGCE